MISRVPAKVISVKQLYTTTMTERVARALYILSEDAGLLSSTDNLLELIEDYFDGDDPPGNV